MKFVKSQICVWLPPSPLIVLKNIYSVICSLKPGSGQISKPYKVTKCFCSHRLMESCWYCCRFNCIVCRGAASLKTFLHPNLHIITYTLPLHFSTGASIPRPLIGGPWPRPLLMISSRPSLGGWTWKHILTLQFSLTSLSTHYDPMICTTTNSLSSTNSRACSNSVSIESLIPIQPSHALSSPCFSSSSITSIEVFSNESVICVRWPEYWALSFSVMNHSEIYFL